MAASKLEGQASLKTKRSPCRILIVEDEAEQRDLLRTIFEAAGYNVATAANGEEALQAIRTCQPDVALADLVMPVMDGWTFAYKLRSEGYQCPLVVLSAFAMSDALQVDVRPEAYLAKPFDLGRLIEVVGRFCPM